MKKIIFAIFTILSIGLQAQVYINCDTTVVEEIRCAYGSTGDTITRWTYDVTKRTCLIVGTSDSIKFTLSETLTSTYDYPQSTVTGSQTLVDTIVFKPGYGGSDSSMYLVSVDGLAFINESGADDDDVYYNPDDGFNISSGLKSTQIKRDRVRIGDTSNSSSLLMKDGIIVVDRPTGYSPSDNHDISRGESKILIRDSLIVPKNLINSKADTAHNHDVRYFTKSEVSTAISEKADTFNQVFTGTITLPATTSIGSVDNTEISYINGLTSSAQDQLNAKAASSHTHSISNVTGLVDTIAMLRDSIDALRADIGSGGGGGEIRSDTTYYLASQFANSTTTFNDVTGWSFPVTAGKLYRIEIVAQGSTAATTTGIQMRLNATNSRGRLISHHRYQNGTNNSGSGFVPFTLLQTVNADGAWGLMPGTGAGATSAGYVSISSVYSFNCTTSGSLKVQLASEIASSNVSIEDGSVLIINKLN